MNIRAHTWLEVRTQCKMPSLISTVQVMVSSKRSHNTHCMFMSSPFKYDRNSSRDVYISLGMRISLGLGQVYLLAGHIVSSSTLTLQWLAVAAAPAVLRRMPPCPAGTHCFCLNLVLSSTDSRGVERCIRGMQAAGRRQIVWVLIFKGSLH